MSLIYNDDVAVEPDLLRPSGLWIDQVVVPWVRVRVRVSTFCTRLLTKQLHLPCAVRQAMVKGAAGIDQAVASAVFSMASDS
jgi:hypothetical protein